jgi:hypothetical protein
MEHSFAEFNSKLDSCPHCEFISKVFNSADMTNREYWIMTEVFVYLHNGKDYCDYKKQISSKELLENRL